MNTRRKIDMRKQLSIIWQHTRHYWFLWILFPMLIGVDIAFELGIAKIQGVFIDTVDSGTKEQLLNVTKLVTGLLLGAMLLLGLHRHLIVKLSGLLNRDLTLRLFQMMNHLPYLSLRKHHTGNLMTRIKDDVTHGSDLIEAAIEFLTVLFLILLSFAYLAHIDLLLAVIAIASVPVLFFIGRFFDGRIRGQSADVEEHEGELRETVQEYVQALPLVKVYGASSIFLRQFRLKREQLGRAERRLMMTNTISEHVTEAVFNLIYTGALLFIALAAVRNSLTPGTIVTFSVLFELVVWPVIGLSHQYSRVQEGVGAFHRVQQFLEWNASKPAIRTENFKRQAPGVSAMMESPVLSLNNVSFQPENSRLPILNGINFTLRAGEIVAVVGPSGAGKTTFAKLCSGLYEPTEGDVSVYGLPAANWLHKGRSEITYVAQHQHLFSGTLKENIKLANPLAADIEVQMAVRMAELEDYIMQLEHRYDTVVSEQAGNLSGGQRQRLALARSFVHDKKLVIMDEPTSALDPAVGNRVAASLKKHLAGKSAIIITHQWNLLHLADRIIVIEHGRIAEEGTQAELLQHDGLFRRFHQMGPDYFHTTA
ncbi:ABC transporter ATP-binding protein [Paenibacillus pinihumi]|uniref:ABC transporter ATP-binding protein n=1 Tax=Paenibacillus pinihumi TaxID=669462 RepID=UPI00040B9AC0|nr:ABC transporter ATP-binding protein [Paenibacillus pinihumi]